MKRYYLCSDIVINIVQIDFARIITYGKCLLWPNQSISFYVLRCFVTGRFYPYPLKLLHRQYNKVQEIHVNISWEILYDLRLTHWSWKLVNFHRHFLKMKIMLWLEFDWFVPNGPINNILALIQIMAWRRSGANPLSESMRAYFTGVYMRHSVPVSKCVTRIHLFLIIESTRIFFSLHCFLF